MIVLIAPEQDIPNEIEILQQLFQEGLQCYHLRKPHKNYNAHLDYLNKIDTNYHNRIVVHYHHNLIQKFNLKGIHFQEQKRKDTDNISEYISNLNLEKTISVSSSFHDPEILAQCPFQFNYHLLSPVFSSISKKGYEGKGFNVNHIKKKIIGMGGINTTTIADTFRLGYKGIGVLGGVWNSDHPVESFKSIQQHYQQHAF